MFRGKSAARVWQSQIYFVACARVQLLLHTLSGVHAGVWGVLTEKFHSSKLMGLYGAARDVPPLFLI